MPDADLFTGDPELAALGLGEGARELLLAGLLVAASAIRTVRLVAAFLPPLFLPLLAWTAAAAAADATFDWPVGANAALAASSPLVEQASTCSSSIAANAAAASSSAALGALAPLSRRSSPPC